MTGQLARRRAVTIHAASLPLDTGRADRGPLPAPPAVAAFKLVMPMRQSTTGFALRRGIAGKGLRGVQGAHPLRCASPPPRDMLKQPVALKVRVSSCHSEQREAPG
jgi:hypothetical protein